MKDNHESAKSHCLIKALKLLNCMESEKKPYLTASDKLKEPSSIILHETFIKNISDANLLAKAFNIPFIQVKNIRKLIPKAYKVVDENNVYLINKETRDGKLLSLYWVSK